MLSFHISIPIYQDDPTPAQSPISPHIHQLLPMLFARPYMHMLIPSAGRRLMTPSSFIYIFFAHIKARQQHCWQICAKRWFAPDLNSPAKAIQIDAFSHILDR
jgi:hypothetical protein